MQMNSFSIKFSQPFQLILFHAKTGKKLSAEQLNNGALPTLDSYSNKEYTHTHTHTHSVYSLTKYSSLTMTNAIEAAWRYLTTVFCSPVA